LPKMKKYIALLRGINVSGQKLIKMTELKGHLEELNFKNVLTYIQSGNIIFEIEKTDTTILAIKIVEKIKEKYGWELPVIVKSETEWDFLFNNNPFITQKNLDIERLYVTFLGNQPSQILLNDFFKIDYSPEAFIINGNELYVFCPIGYGSTKFNNNYIEAKLKVKATTRNWKTIIKLQTLLGI